jgi:tetratricopeptide (TPR) repeat protein
MKHNTHMPTVHDLEADVLLWFYRYRKMLYTLLALVVAAGLVWWGHGAYKTTLKERYQGAYQALVSLEDKAQFLDQFATQPLAIVVGLELGHHHYQEAQYPQAAQYYQKALDASQGTLWEPVCRLGYALSLWASGQGQAACIDLERLALDPACPATLAAEATYHLLLHAQTSGDEAGVKRWMAHLGQVPSSSLAFFRHKAQLLGLMHEVE